MNSRAEAILRRKDIKQAFDLPLLSEWQKGDSYREAEQPARIGRALIDELHTHLVNARIGYVFREKMADRDRVTLAKASKVGAKLQYFSNLDFLIEVNWEAWVELSHEARVALMDHELCHFDREENDETGAVSWVMKSHDVEEFGQIVTRWGLWRPDLERFGKVVSEQLELAVAG